MFIKPKQASVLWTGGKDSALALYEAQLMGYNVVNLVTFAPVGENFRAHPLDFMAHQAEALSISHSIIGTKEAFKKNYEDAICALKENDGIDILVTGDISEVDGHPNWIRECSEPSRMEVYTPLWHSDRTVLIKRLFSSGFKVIFSCVKRPWFTEDWVGSSLDNNTFGLLLKMSADTGFDICGENGEYHTLVFDGPPFKKKIHIESCSTCQEDSLMYLDIHSTKLCDKGCPQ
jgi:diphthine-ammonia ligase